MTLRRKPPSNQRAGIQARLDQQCAQTQRADDAVAPWKKSALAWVIGWKFTTHHAARRHNRIKQRRMLWRIRTANAARKHHHGAPMMAQRRSMRGGVNSARAARNNRESLLSKPTRESIGLLHSIGGANAATNNRHRKTIRLLERAAHPQCQRLRRGGL